MGEARRRGTREQRKTEAENKKLAEAAELQERQIFAKLYTENPVVDWDLNGKPIHFND